MQVDLNKFLNKDCKIFCGRDEGTLVRKKLNLDEFDDTDDTMHLYISSEVHSITSSFFLSCFGPSIRNLGEIEFRRKYIFECDTVLLSNVDDGISRALKTSFPLKTYDFLNADPDTRKNV